MSADDTLAVVETLFAAIEAGDVELIREEVYTPETVVWHNYDGYAQPAEENLALLRQVVGAISDLRYEVTRRSRVEGGVVQQHVLRGTTRTGKPFALPACMMIEVRDGRVVRIEEYLDSGQLAELSS